MISQNFLLPEIILVNTQLPENLGAVARAMLNFEFQKLRIVSPQFKMNNEKIIPVSAGAEKVLKKIKVFENFKDSIGDLNFVIAVTNRNRAIEKNYIGITDIIKMTKTTKKKVGLVFGPENAGLDNNHISYCDRLFRIPSNPKFSSLNLSHAVMIVCYEINKVLNNGSFKKDYLIETSKEYAKKNEIINFYSLLEEKLESSGFFLVKERKKTTQQKIRKIFGKIQMDSSEIKILMGIIRSLSKDKI